MVTCGDKLECICPYSDLGHDEATCQLPPDHCLHHAETSILRIGGIDTRVTISWERIPKEPK